MRCCIKSNARDVLLIRWMREVCRSVWQPVCINSPHPPVVLLVEFHSLCSSELKPFRSTLNFCTSVHQAALFVSVQFLSVDHNVQLYFNDYNAAEWDVMMLKNDENNILSFTRWSLWCFIRLARQLQKEVQSTNSHDFTEEQKVKAVHSKHDNNDMIIMSWNDIYLFILFSFSRKPWENLQHVLKWEVQRYRWVEIYQ